MMAPSEPQTRDVRPIPDPTVLTTEASNRLEVMLRTLIKTELEHQRELFNAKMDTVVVQFHDLEARTAEQKKDTKDALDAALAAQKEQVFTQNLSFEKNITKSETAATERFKALETLLATSSKASDDKIGDLKDRVIAIEAIKLGTTEGAAGVREQGTDTRAIIASVIGVGLFLIAVVSLVYAFAKP
jgi:hypothetical protein